MLNLYRCLLYLYPRFYRHQFSREMIAVFGELQDTGRARDFRGVFGFLLVKLRGCSPVPCANTWLRSSGL